MNCSVLVISSEPLNDLQFNLAQCDQLYCLRRFEGNQMSGENGPG